MTPELFPLTHEPETAVRPSIYGEGIFVEQWKKVMAEVPEHGDGTTDEMLQVILGDLEALRRPYIQNVDLVVSVMKDYAAQRPTLAYALRWWWKNRQ